MEDDAPDRVAAKNTQTRITRWAEEGHAVALAWPWTERRGDRSDLADVILQHGPEGVAARIAVAEPVRPPPGPRHSLLPAYYPAPDEPREAALARQTETIQRTITEGAQLATLWRQGRARQAELLAAVAEPSKGERAASTCKASQEIDGGPLPKPKRMLITGAQGTGKTAIAIRELAAVRDPITAWVTEPTLEKAEEVAADYRRAAAPDSLPIRVVRGRAAPDPTRQSTMCERPEAAAAIAAARLSVRTSLCPTCPANARCGCLRQDREIAAMETGGVFVLAAPYLYFPSPAPAPDVLVADEDVVLPGVEVVSMPLSDLDPFGMGAIGIDTRDTLNSIRAALASLHALETIRIAQIDKAEIKAVRNSLNAQLDTLVPKFDGSTPDAEIIAALDNPVRRRIHAILTLLSAIVAKSTCRAEASTLSAAVAKRSPSVVFAS